MKRKPLLILLLLATSFPLATIAQDITLNSSQSIALTPGTTRNFYDSGGSSSNYSNSESYTLTLTNAGDITINFSSFTTESSSSCYDWDYMYIYDGTTSGTQLAKGQTGCSSANLTTGTNYTATSGTMTITWHSDGSTNAAGWAATITAASVPGLVPFVDGLETSTWYVVNGSCTNKWYLGSLGARYGTAGLYISNDDGTTNAYSTGSVSVVYAYKNITFPSAGKYNLSFDIKQNGESTYDCVGAMLYDASTTPSASTSSAGSGLTSFPSGYTTMITGVGSSFSGNAWKTSSTDFTVNAAGQYKLTFCWKNDGSGGSNPPAAIDNISVTKVNDVTAVTSPDGMGTMTTSLTWGFEDGSYQGWTVINNDSDAYPWITLSTLGDYTSSYNPSSDYSFWAHNGSGSVLSGSYINGIGALTNIDNYLVSPRLILGGSISFYAKSVDPDYPEQFGVAVCTSDNPTASNFSTIQTWTGASDRDWHLYTVDLSAYTDYGYVAIRNYGTTDQYMVIVDDITITSRSVSNFNRPLASGVSATFNVTPNSGVTFTQWTNNGATVSTSNSYTFTVQEPSALVAVMDVPATVPYTQDFESADHGWAMINGSCANKWYCGAPGGKSGGNGLYISSDNGTNNTYNNSSPTYVYTYKSLTFSEAGDYILLFDLRQQGESTWDCVGAMLYSSSTTPSPSTSYGSYGLDSWPSGYSQFIVGAGVDASGGNWAKISQTFTLSTAGTYKLVFGWKNDSSGGTNPPAAIDNVIVKKNPTYYNVAASANPNSAGNVKFLVGDGGTSTNSYLPCYTYYNYNLTQQIYTPLEIGNVGTINSIAFYNGGDTKTLTDLEFYMVHTFKDEFGNNSDWIPVTSSNLVFSGSNVEMTAGQWTIINLTTPFVYDGLSNLAIVTREHMQYDSGLGCRVFTPASGGNCSIYAYNDNNAYDVTNPSQYNGTRLTVKNQILVNPGGSLTRSFPEGATVTLVEELTNSDYHFENWTDNSSNAGNNEIYAISNLAGAHTVVANFAPNTHTLTASVSPANSGTISANGTNISGSVTYNHGTTVSLTATAASGYTFQNWTIDSNTVSGASTTITMDQDHTVVANFVLTTHTLTLAQNPSNSGTLTVTNNGSTVTSGSLVNEGDVLNINASPNNGYTFTSWSVSGAGSSVANPNSATTTFTMGTADATLTANFTLNSYQVSVSANPSAGGTVTGGGTYNHGASCTVSTTVNAGYTFDGWYEGNNRVSQNTSYTFNVQYAISLEARFTQDEYTLTLTPNPSAGGTVSANPAQATYHYGDVVTITATANPGYTFDSWSDNGAASHTVTITGNATYTATFTQDEYTLTLNANPSAGGTVSASPSQQTYHYGDVVTISATAATGYTFTSWSDNGTQSHTVTINGNDSYTATFTQDEYTLTLNANPSAGGTLTASPSGPYHYGDQVTITATANSGYTFASWSDNGAAQHTVTITGNATYTATFTQDEYTLTLNANPSAGGTVSASPSQAYYHYGDQVTITATANSGYTFGSWSDGGAQSHDVTITGNATYTAYFGADHTLTTYATPMEGGWITADVASTIDVIDVGTGNTTTSNTPYATGAYKSYQQCLYKANEINAPVNGVYITSISYQLMSNSNAQTNHIEIYMKNSSLNEFAGTNNSSFETVTVEENKVFDGDWYIPTVGSDPEWVTIILDRPFYYNGTSNLMIGIHENTNQNKTANFVYTQTSHNSRLNTYGNQSTCPDPNPLDPNTFNASGLTKGRDKVRANVRLGFGTYHNGQSVTLTAHANEGYQFVNWTENDFEIGTNDTYSVTMNADHTIYANFERLAKRFITAGDWNVANNWSPAGAPDITEDVYIEAAATIPSGCVATANEINITTGSITIADGGQLQHNNTGVSLTAQKEITGYTEPFAETNKTYYLFSSPVIASPSYSGIITTPHYDLYSFDASADPLEWILSTPSDIAPYTGFIYASRTDTRIEISGTVPPSNTTPTHQLNYSTGRFVGWNLIGNPFVCNAYVTHDNNVTMDYYVLNHQTNYDEFMTASSSDPVAPLSALMVKASASGQSVTYSRTAPSPSAKTGILNIDVRTMERGTALLDRARLRFGEGEGLEKFQFNPNHTKVYIPDGDKDFAVYYAEGAGTIPVNFKAENNGRYTLDFSTEDVGFNYIHLIDNMNGNDVDLLKTPYYAFDARSTDYASRFTIVFATGDSNDGNFAFYNNGLWIINNDGEATLQVVDALGRILSSETISGSCSKAINAAPGVYMLRLINGNDVKVQKIVVRR